MRGEKETVMHNHGKKSWGRKMILGVGIIAHCSSASLAADSITGVVRNQTHGRPATGDDVILFGAGQGVQAEARTKIDAQGSFALEVQNPEKPHLVRVIHQGVNYDQQVSAGKTISVDVFDAAAKVRGVTGGIEIIRVGTNGSLLHVSDMVEIKNDSNPPMTQASDRTFEVYLPVHAKIDSVLAAGPENIGDMITATPVRGEPGHYTVDFPLRPGATKFAFNYNMPYDGHAAFRTKIMYPLQQLAVMIPPTMTFTSPSPAFQILPVGNDRYRVEAAEHLNAGDAPEFEISGVGALPLMRSQVHVPTNPPAGPLTGPALSTRGNSELHAHDVSAAVAVPVSTHAIPSSRWQWWALGVGVFLMLVTCGFLTWRKRRRRVHATAMAAQMTGQAGQTPATLIEALKEGLFQLEIDRLQGAIPGEEYASAKQSLENTIEWALARAGDRRETTPRVMSPDVSHPSAT
jgi:hypothetical protein